jgi:ubiquinone/menaquinone biosynthesis C-methylase UbiE
MKNQFGKSYFENEIMDEKTSLKREGYLKIVKKIITELPPGSKILDVGCGKGAYLKDINRIRSDLELYGVDIGNVKEFLPDYINFEVSSGDDLPFEDEKFDLIICFHVLEHVLNPMDFLREFNRVLKNEGLVYVEMPYYKTINSPEGNVNFWSDPTHVRPYNRCSIQRMLNYTHFDIIKIKVWRTYLTILIGPYLILKRLFLKDYDALSTLYCHLVGHSIGGLGKKIDK